MQASFARSAVVFLGGVLAVQVWQTYFGSGAGGARRNGGPTFSMDKEISRQTRDVRVGRDCEIAASAMADDQARPQHGDVIERDAADLPPLPANRYRQADSHAYARTSYAALKAQVMAPAITLDDEAQTDPEAAPTRYRATPTRHH